MRKRADRTSLCDVVKRWQRSLAPDGLFKIREKKMCLVREDKHTSGASVSYVSYVSHTHVSPGRSSPAVGSVFSSSLFLTAVVL